MDQEACDRSQDDPERMRFRGKTIENIPDTVLISPADIEHQLPFADTEPDHKDHGQDQKQSEDHHAGCHQGHTGLYR